MTHDNGEHFKYFGRTYLIEIETETKNFVNFLGSLKEKKNPRPKKGDFH